MKREEWEPVVVAVVMFAVALAFIGLGKLVN